MNVRTTLTATTLLIFAALASGQELASRPATAPAEEPNTVARAYPNIASAGLIHARPVELPEGVLLRAGDLKITQKDIDAVITKAPEALREQLRKNAFFLLEQMATRQLLTEEAKAAATKDGKDVSQLSEQELLKAYFDKLTAEVKVTDAEVANFYRKNKDMVGGQPLKTVKEAIANVLRQQKQQEIVAERVRSLGKRTPVRVQSAWIDRQAKLAKDNPVDKARASGKPTLVDFGSEGCRPCEMLQPILKNLRRKFGEKANILFVSVREWQMLASRYGVRYIRRPFDLPMGATRLRMRRRPDEPPAERATVGASLAFAGPSAPWG